MIWPCIWVAMAIFVWLCAFVPVLFWAMMCVGCGVAALFVGTAVGAYLDELIWERYG